MNRVKKLFQSKKNRILNIYFTAGHPIIDSLNILVPSLDKSGVDLVEIGMPYSDPLADGPTIQASSSIALHNGMSLDLMFKQIKTLREHNQTPLILMGYYNQVIQYGVEKFLETASDCGVDSLIIPDLPMDEYVQLWKSKFENLNLGISFLVTPQTSDIRIRKAAELSSAFLYVISQSSITGSNRDIGKQQSEYFKKVKSLASNTPILVGFGIHDKHSFDAVCAHADGAIIGSAYIRKLADSKDIEKTTIQFVQSIIA